MAPGRQGSEGILLEAPKFFKIVFDNSVHKLRIPTKFTKKYGQYLPDSISLKVGGGPVMWKIELIHCDGEIWMQNGWGEFNEHYSLDFGHLLVFEYAGNSCFNVLIFDLSATEIEYPISHAANDGLESDDSDSVVFKEEYNNKGKEKNVQEANQEDDYVSREILDSPTSRRYKRRKTQTADKHSAKVRGRRESPNSVVRGTCLTYQTAKAFMSDKKNPYFVSLMRPTYVSKTFNLNVPLSFVKENLPNGKSSDVVLSVPKGGRWFVRCNIGIGSAKISSLAWKKFVHDNKLKVGDSCVFEMTKTAKLEWKVTIFRS